jgi:hypothetical protein
VVPLLYQGEKNKAPLDKEGLGEILNKVIPTKFSFLVTTFHTLHNRLDIAF